MEFIALVDLMIMEVMDSAVYLGIILGVTFSVIRLGMEGFLFSFRGIIYGAGIIALIFYISNGKMGEGDIGIGAVMGAWLGEANALVALFVSFIIGGLCASILLAFKLKRFGDKLPLGPFLAIGSGVAFLEGSVLIKLYWMMMG